GLPIARWIADAHGGSLEVEDSGTSGSTFRILLPLEENEHGGHQGQPIKNA
ncbi:MAG: two-component sensor histidine kinase, partial [Acidobacteria bacterium]